jgi:hypothetical protein
LVGPHWLGRSDGGRNRIDDPADPVRFELEGAFECGIPVIPVLIDSATMPSEMDLPPSLKQFSFLNAAPVDSGRDFRPHMDRLVRSLDGILGSKSEAAVAVSRGKPSSDAMVRSGKPWYVLAAIVLLVGAGTLLATLWMHQPARDPQPEIAKRSPTVSAPELPPPSTQQPAVVLKSAEEFLARKYANDIKSANVNLAIEF